MTAISQPQPGRGRPQPHGHELALCEWLMTLQSHLMDAQRQLEQLARSVLDGHQLRAVCTARPQRVSESIERLSNLSRIWELHQVGLSTRQIAKVLKREGRERNGAPWTVSGIRGTLDRLELDPPNTNMTGALPQ